VSSSKSLQIVTIDQWPHNLTWERKALHALEVKVNKIKTSPSGNDIFTTSIVFGTLANCLSTTVSYDVASIAVNHQKGDNKLPDESDRGSSSPRPRRSECYKPSKHREGKNSPRHQGRWKEVECSPERRHKIPYKGSFTRRITEYPIPRAFAKPPKLETYGDTTDPDEHMEHLVTILDYHRARGAVKCKLFVLTLKGTAMTWFKGIQVNYIDSWGELCNEFTSHFIARRKQPQTWTTL